MKLMILEFSLSIQLTNIFFYIVRHRLFEKAFRLAIDLNDHDLFMDIHYYALITNDTEMATAAKEKAEHILVRSNSCSSTREKVYKLESQFSINL